jgi:hypothetical protein
MLLQLKKQKTLVLEERLNIDIKFKIDDYKIFNLNKQLQSTPENSDKWNKIKKEIGKVDGEINERVFGLYGLTKEEIEIVKNNKN